MKHLFSLLVAGLLAFVGCCSSSDKVLTDPPGILFTKFAMPVVLSDGMVVQQNAVASYWGVANPHETISGVASWHPEPLTTAADGEGRWRLDIPTPAASMESHWVEISDSYGYAKRIEDVLIGEVWHFAGQSNMEMPMRGFGSVANGNYQPVKDAEAEIAAASRLSHLRYFKVGYQESDVPMEDVRETRWWRADIAEEAKEFSALAFFCGRKLATELNIPIGILCTPYGGTRIEAWMPAERLKQFHPNDYKDASELSGSAVKKSAPGVLYNGMVCPIEKYTIHGWAWYQGESNRDTHHSYARLQQALVEEWRKAKGDTQNDLPFFYVQISGIKSSSEDGAKLIEAQWDGKALIPNSDLITTSDVGDIDFIHYPDKRTPGERLANLMLCKRYGRSDINPYGPAVERIRYEGNEAIVHFTNAEGLRATQSPIPYVQVAGSDGKFYAATATLGSDGTLVASSPEVAVPVAVRYCYSSWHLSTLFNSAGVPLAPFRSDR